ncbi:zinc ribbon domain-containing protein [Nodosilinea sp. LEGE 07088]|uniref:FmdB family zinc ribbon protein n=1 Tax=Nodosilinea sp. LEGE 07088 TaxID=2777968 RepID=UPI0018802498|nr:zinc ribbon domain-containing protein [Nodosilinea sp. LEGE 07088]MBE9140580.1 zinc ribbon domain-containing protein [Nodosilinea sp. LEGE 07088]
MPLYDYRCETCGDFEAWRKLADLETPMVCPTCNAAVSRLFLPPNVNLNSGSFASIGDRAAKEPRVVKRGAKEPAPSRAQSATGSRPWMISHSPERL